jgi:ComF family protein
MVGTELAIEEPIAENEALLQRVKKHGSLAFARLVNVITPPKCLVCRCAVTLGATLCVACWQKLQLIDEPVCDVLGTPFEYDQGEGAVSAAAVADPPPWDRARAAAAFNDTSKHLIHLLKYQDTQEAGIAMARMMTGAGRRLLADSDVLVPVPLHRFRLWQRRFNQSAYLADHIAKATGKPCVTDVLLRDRRTRQQVGLTAKERRSNVRKAFSVPPERQFVIDGKNVVLVDDVRTTGATVSACASVLKDAGAAEVNVLTFALVLEPLHLHIDV